MLWQGADMAGGMHGSPGGLRDLYLVLVPKLDMDQEDVERSLRRLRIELMELDIESVVPVSTEIRRRVLRE